MATYIKRLEICLIHFRSLRRRRNLKVIVFLPCIILTFLFPLFYVSLTCRFLYTKVKPIFGHLSYLQQRWLILLLDHCVTENNRVTFQVTFFVKTLNHAHLTTFVWHQSNRCRNGRLVGLTWIPCGLWMSRVLLLEQFRSKMAAGKRSTCRSSHLNSFSCFWPFFLIFFKSQEPVYLSH